MRYQTLGKSGLRASVAALGTWGLGGGSVWSDETPDAAAAERLLDKAEELGINYIDTAPVYGTGRSEELLGRALRGRREKFLLQSKCSLNWRGEGGNFHYSRDGFTVNNDTSAAAVRRDVEDSLRRMGTDWLDVVVVHYVCGDWSVEETAGALEELRREGKIRAFGLSNSRPADLEDYQKYADVALVQEQFGLLAPLHGEEYFPMAAKYGVTFQCYGALEEGYLTGPESFERTYPRGDIRARLPWTEEPRRSAILRLYREVWGPMRDKYDCSYANLFQAWTLARYPEMSLLTGCRRAETLEDTVRALDLRLETEDLRRLSETAKEVQVAVLDK